MLIRVAFRYGDSRPFARLVCWWTRHDAAHCEVAWAWDGERHECVSSSWLDGGVRGKSIDMPPSKWRIYEVDAKHDPREWLKKRKGWLYDWLGLFGFVWRRIKGFMRRMFCSEACMDILGVPDPWRFDPAAAEAVVAAHGRRVQ